LHIQDVVTIKLDCEEIVRIPTVSRVVDDAGPVDQVAFFIRNPSTWMQRRDANICAWGIFAQSTALHEDRQVRLITIPSARHAVQGVTDYCLNRCEAAKMHRNLVARCQGFNRPVAISRPDLRAPRKAIASTVAAASIGLLTYATASVAVAGIARGRQRHLAQRAGCQDRTQYQSASLQRIAPYPIDFRGSADVLPSDFASRLRG
jgi:hypothetical protein